MVLTDGRGGWQQTVLDDLAAACEHEGWGGGVAPRGDDDDGDGDGDGDEAPEAPAAAWARLARLQARSVCPYVPRDVAGR
jgi:hypothetical protein